MSRQLESGDRTIQTREQRKYECSQISPADHVPRHRRSSSHSFQYILVFTGSVHVLFNKIPQWGQIRRCEWPQFFRNDPLRQSNSSTALAAWHVEPFCSLSLLLEVSVSAIIQYITLYYGRVLNGSPCINGAQYCCYTYKYEMLLDIMTTVFWDVTLRRLVHKHRHFVEICCLRLLDIRLSLLLWRWRHGKFEMWGPVCTDTSETRVRGHQALIAKCEQDILRLYLQGDCRQPDVNVNIT